MSYFIPSTQLEFDNIINGFRIKTLPAKEWTHEAHLIAGLWHVANFGFEEALVRMRENIKDYNVATGGQNTDSSGYHESITVFWVWLLDKFWKANSIENQDFERICNAYLKSKYSDRNAAFIFYSREKLFSTEARLAFVAPDIQAFAFDIL